MNNYHVQLFQIELKCNWKCYYQDNYKYLKSLKSLAGIGHKSIQIISTINPLKQQPECALEMKLKVL